jgi:conjugal transfer pilus assembly protein TraD
MGDGKPVSVNESSWYGHTCITGNVGTGKTTLLRLMSINALHMGNMLFVLDPKNDHDWQESIKQELEYLGMGDKFYHLHPSSPSTSCRIPLLKNFTRLTEVAARIAPLMGGDGSGKAFQDFAYDVIYATTVGLDYLGEPVRLTSIGKVIKSDKRGLALRVLNKYFTRLMGDEYRGKISGELKEISTDLLEGLAGYYLAHSESFTGKTITGEPMSENENKAVEAMIGFALHDDGHYQKMISTLKPVFTALTADPLDELFSPIHEKNINDPRDIVDLAEIMETGGCLYVSLDSMTDGVTASFLSRLLLAEACAVAGDRYNQKDMNPTRVTIANDEVHASIENNDALFNMMAQGRAASVQMILATQTISDIAAKTDKPSADRFLGLCNNFISMRTTDPITQEYVSSQFAQASVAQQQVRTGTQRDTSKSALSFSAGYQETLMKTREDMFPPSLLGDLPILQYVARLSDGKKLKMKLPIIINNDKDGEVASWVE